MSKKTVKAVETDARLQCTDCNKNRPATMFDENETSCLLCKEKSKQEEQPKKVKSGRPKWISTLKPEQVEIILECMREKMSKKETARLAEVTYVSLHNNIG